LGTQARGARCGHSQGSIVHCISYRGTRIGHDFFVRRRLRCLTIGSSDRGSRLRWAKEGVDDWDKVRSFDAGEAPRRSTSSLGARLKAALLSALFGAILSQGAMRVEPLASVARTFPTPSIYWVVGVFTALLSLIVLFCGRNLAQRSGRPVWLCILGAGVFFVLMIVCIPGGRGSVDSQYPPLELMLSAVEIGICFGPAALIGHIAGT